MTNYRYQTAWVGYAHPETNTVTRTEVMKTQLSQLDFKSKKFAASGVPLIVQDDNAYVNNETENTIIFGETGSKKSRCLIAPLMVTAAGAGESAFITDVKGELYGNSKLRGFIESKGVKTVCLDFRNFDKDSFNILEPAYILYKSGRKSEASTIVHRFVDSLAARHREAKADPFWDTNASQGLVAVIMFIFEVCSNTKGENLDEYVNILTVGNFMTEKSIDGLKTVMSKYMPRVDNNIAVMLGNLVNLPEKTLACVLATASGMIKDLLIQERLMRMLSASTFSIDDMYEKPTFVFFIVPDETSAYDSIAGLLIDTFYSRLIEIYSSRYQDIGEAPCRINFICDEFCNLGINDMKAKISASRSRNMRWFLACQSKSQLESAYSGDASTILGNCKNTFFLQSSDIGLLQYISDICGKTSVTPSGSKENLITHEVLRGLKKTYEFKEVLFIRDNVKYFATLPDIGTYTFLENFRARQTKSSECKKISAYSPFRLDKDIESGKVKIPYSTT